MRTMRRARTRILKKIFPIGKFQRTGKVFSAGVHTHVHGNVSFYKNISIIYIHERRYIKIELQIFTLDILYYITMENLSYVRSREKFSEKS